MTKRKWLGLGAGLIGLGFLSAFTLQAPGPLPFLLIVGGLACGGGAFRKELNAMQMPAHQLRTEPSLDEPGDSAPEEAGHNARLAEIDAFFANELNPITVSVGQAVPSLITRQSIKRGVEEAAQRISSTLKGVDTRDNLLLAAFQDVSTASNLSTVVKGIEGASLTRTLRDMTEAERASLRLADMLEALGVFNRIDVVRVRIPIVWNGGKCAVSFGPVNIRADKITAIREGLRIIILATFGDVTQGLEKVQEGLRRSLGSDILPEDVRVSLERYVVRGARWMTPHEGRSALVRNPSSPSVVRLGTFTGSPQELLFDMNESLLTIAPPGSGKSQALVLRNLLHMRSPAVVLDIKGEMFRGSQRWRKENIGEVIMFSPTTPKLSQHYNPLDAVRANPFHVWEDARKLADLLVVPSAKGDTYFENRARDMIATAIADVAQSEPDDARTMASVLDRLYVSDDETIIAWCDHLASLSTQLRRQGDALRGMPAKQREAVFDEARRHLEVWQSPALEQITARSDFSHHSLRMSNATLYGVTSSFVR